MPDRHRGALLRPRRPTSAAIRGTESDCSLAQKWSTVNSACDSPCRRKQRPLHRTSLSMLLNRGGRGPMVQGAVRRPARQPFYKVKWRIAACTHCFDASVAKAHGGESAKVRKSAEARRGTAFASSDFAAMVGCERRRSHTRTPHTSQGETR